MRNKIIFIFFFLLFWANVGASLYVFSAEDTKEFKKGCLTCHKETLDKWDACENKHYPYKEQKCEACHASEHKKFTAEVEKPCLVCHDLTSDKIKKAHFGANLTGVNCFSCHYTHGSDQKGLLKESAHMPFASGSCDMCHKLTNEGKVKTKEGMKKICLACHSNIVSKEDTITHPAYEAFDCTNCHNPHTSSQGKLLVKDSTELCFDCHDKKQAEKHPFDTAPSLKIILEKDDKIWLNYKKRIDCVSCHKAHAAKLPFLLKDTPKDGKLCYNCHKKQ